MVSYRGRPHSDVAAGGRREDHKMRTGTAAVMLAGLVVIIGVTYAFLRERAAPAEAEPPGAITPETSSRVVQVDEVAKNPERFRGEIVLRAVVVGVRK